MTPPRLFGEAAKCRLDAAIHRTRALLSSSRRRLRAYDALLACAQRHGLFVTGRRDGDAPAVETGILHLSAEHGAWVRPPHAWSPPTSTSSPWTRFAALAEHLLSLYPMPRFMASVWLDADAGHAERRAWYRRLGQGEGIRRLGLPIRLTRAMAHRVQFAPDHVSVAGALRWAQLVELGASPALVASVLATRLGRELEDEEFWETVVQFFVNHPELDVVHVGPIVDFLQHHRFERREGVTASGRVGLLPPPDPTFLVKGRTPSSLLRMVRQWHDDLGRGALVAQTWSPSGLRGMSWVERVVTRTDGEVRTVARLWTIRELCSTAALRAEGSAMRHCVASYVGACVGGRSSIWSVQVETSQAHRRVLTLEVNARTRAIVQARRKANALPSEAERALLLRWAAQEGLAVQDRALIAR